MAGMAIASWLSIREQSRTWGLAPGAADRSLPGDDLVPAPDHTDTRSLVIDAPPAQVWAWLAQLARRRTGWFSYGFLDRRFSPVGAAMGRSATPPAAGDLSEGDVVPTNPGGGFVARVVEPEHALVLFLDDEIVREQTRALAATSGSEGAARAATELEDMPGFGATWSYVLEPEPGDRTLLIGRFRVSMEMAAQQRRLLPLMGLGAFALMRSQMLGIKRLAEAS
jgi:proline iminopeptidase